MPVRVGKCGKKWCVKDPDGTTVPGGEHNTEQEAADHAAAINANTEKGVMTTQSNTNSGSTTSSDTVTNGYVQITDSVTYPSKTYGDTIVFPELEPEVKKALEEKGLEEAMMFGPESFEELDQLREHNDKQMAITKVVHDFMALVGNVFSWPGPNRSKRVKELASEMIDRLPDDDEDEIEDDEQEEEKEVDYVNIDNKNSFFVWKEENGTYRWLGVYSNKFRDDDRPAEILSEQSHIGFIERVEKGELAYPDLYVWHIKTAIGKSDMLAYDDTGFCIASGTMEEDFALALMNTSEDLAMSHGMPSESIERSKEDPTVITSYVSTEVSVLPRSAAANKRTDFRILKEEATMSIVPADKRQQIAELLGEDLTQKLEAGLDEKAQEANAAGVEFKEEPGETEVLDEVAASEEDVTEPSTEEPEGAPESEEKEDEVVAEGDAVEANVEDEPSATPEEDVDTGAADGNNYVDKEELAETLAEILTAITNSNAAVADAVKSLADRVDAIEEAEESASVRAGELELAASTPQASLQDLLRKQLAEPASTVIGKKAAAVHGNSRLANAKPKETELDEEDPIKNDGLFWRSW
jgi:hypothetical protein